VQISDQYLRHLDLHGYAVVPDFLTADELAAGRAEMFQHFPTAQELWAAPRKYEFVFEDPEHLQVEFPFGGLALNRNATHPDLIGFVEKALGDSEVLLTQAAIWAKYAGTGEFEQEMHLDYQGNTLVVPRDDGTFRQVNMILYYSDVTEDLGATCVVSKTKTRDLSPWPPFRPRSKWSRLYAQETPITAKAGSLLIFQMGTFHRAGEITAAPPAARFTQHLVWRSARHAFAGYHLWSRFGENDVLERFIEQATPRQREVLGFPPPGHPYWNEQTLAGVAARYPAMDMTPYRTQRQSQ